MESLRREQQLMEVGPGLLGLGAGLAGARSALDELLTTMGRERGAGVVRFPPVITEEILEISGFNASFPQLSGIVCGRVNTDSRTPAANSAVPYGQTGYALAPAACYAAYANMRGRRVGTTSELLDVSSLCFRHEPSGEVGRLVSFTQHEHVCIGEAPIVQDWFEESRTWALRLVQDLGIDAQLVIASDPFFGAGGRLLASMQRERLLKFEIVAPIQGELVAVASCNYHEDHFGRSFDIVDRGGGAAHSACLGFGLERLLLALVSAQGADAMRWPDSVRELLWS